jgi:hypothetical protein
MSQELVQKKIRISSKTLAGINQLIVDYEIENESALYRQFIEIGFALKKKQLDGDIGSGSEYLHVDASKQANYHTQLLEIIAKNIGNVTDKDLEKMKQSTIEYNHCVLANVKEFHKVDKENVKRMKDTS